MGSSLIGCHRDLVVCGPIGYKPAQFFATKHELRIYAGSNPPPVCLRFAMVRTPDH